MELNDIKTVDIRPDNFPRCTLLPRTNVHDNNLEYARYFIKKRLTVQPPIIPEPKPKSKANPKAKPQEKDMPDLMSRGKWKRKNEKIQAKGKYMPRYGKGASYEQKPFKPKYQFVATRKRIENENDHKAGQPNVFARQMGSIYCENSHVEGLTVTNEIKAKQHDRHCGIMQYLVALCFFDRDVNPGINKPTYWFYKLDLPDVFSHYRKDVDDVNQLFNDPKNIQRYVETQCKNVVEFEMIQQSRTLTAALGPATARLLRQVMEGARYAGYGTIIWYRHDEDGDLDCDNHAWGRGSSTDLLKAFEGDENERVLVQFYINTRKYKRWYFCDAPVESIPIKKFLKCDVTCTNVEFNEAMLL